MGAADHGCRLVWVPPGMGAAGHGRHRAWVSPGKVVQVKETGPCGVPLAVLVGLSRLGGVWVRGSPWASAAPTAVASRLRRARPCPSPGHLQEVSPRASAASVRALLAEARAKRLERVEGAVRVINDVRQVLAIEESADEGA